MRNKLGIILALLIIIPGLLFSVSCAKKTAAVKTSDSEMSADEAARRGLEEEGLGGTGAGEGLKTAAEEARDRFINEDIYFEFDKSDIMQEAQEILREKAKWLEANPDASVIIEGHCDERGTNDYNIALGDRRANSTKQFLVDMGVSSSRMETISYGEEHPVATGHNEEAWAKNRRAHFIIK
jgi:peptidoglycan-associated lipoprotein